ncbi:endothelin-1-like isoform X2 [Clupea harengus]|uniref:Endothelin-1 n=1 Tax=Clupea harengus TaxID=7950 RepID=A0A6P8H481_CLUHA|nr:endothelin-1-like isoform X2 [Clupea harengus]
MAVSNCSIEEKKCHNFCITLVFSLFSAASVSTAEVMVAGTSSPVHHIRSKRCSCATFLDKECVYFCHLDIIWVNTPERTVSYGLGNVERKKRSLRELSDSKQKSRCKCKDEKDIKCTTFCETVNIRYQTASVKQIHAAEGDGGVKRQCKHELTAKTRRIKRERRRTGVVDRTARRGSRNARLLLEKWRNRQHHRQKAWLTRNAAA